MSGERNRQQQSHPENEQGFILIVTMLVLVVLSIMCISALDNSTFELQIAANDRQNRVVFNLADGGSYVAGNLIGETMDASGNPAHDNLFYVDIFDPTDSEYSPAAVMTDPPPTTIGLIANPQVSVSGTMRDAFHSRVMGFTAPRTDDKYDFVLRDDQGDIYGRITDRKSENSAGQSADYGGAAGGVGAGSLGSTALVTDLDIDAYSARNTRSRLAVRYRKVLGSVGP
jgi:type II secretory pathway pseudopilin PulG